MTFSHCKISLFQAKGLQIQTFLWLLVCQAIYFLNLLVPRLNFGIFLARANRSYLDHGVILGHNKRNLGQLNQFCSIFGNGIAHMNFIHTG